MPWPAKKEVGLLDYVMSRDSKLVSGTFAEGYLPKDKRFLGRYLTTRAQRAFLCYYLAFRQYEHFTDHTGHSVTMRWGKELATRIEKLEFGLSQARSSGDFELVAQIETGKWEIPDS